MDLLDYIKESTKKAEIKKAQDIIVANSWEERAIKAVDECIRIILNKSKKEIDRILLNNRPHRFDITIVISSPIKDTPSKAGLPFPTGVASWSKDTLTGVSHYRGDAGIHVSNKKEREYCTKKIEDKLIEEGFSIIAKKKNKFRTSSYNVIITALMIW